MAATKDDYDSVPMTEKGAEEKPKDVDDGADDEGAVALKPKMTLLNGCTVIVGSIIGSGIFVSPSGVLMQTGSVMMALMVWIISGVFSMIGAYCYAELGCMIKKTGADYAYIMVTLGPFMAFIRLWVECMIVRPCSQAIVALTFAIYATKPFFPECNPPDESVRLLAAVCICKFNVCSLKSTLQGLYSLVKNDQLNPVIVLLLCVRIVSVFAMGSMRSNHASGIGRIGGKID